ncbi:malto-oligosyltrehalose synthase [Geomonas sp. RF6]|uniref:malto-oligosyltrehalose synthase n=1 Tax=Geomonas sp. RF6 TaxID=2897342 RepID=UPI001E441174|nr:malto-oligosyltrehalose synthase [Geomonas sp. RF6]UFS70450.1 malto-oligosyltrehalose synthase [Geomonas sp. RF6]
MPAEKSTACVPVATYRLQFNKDLGFKTVTSLIPYLAELGITHIYASPYLKARPGSLHGYDIVDHRSINPEVGTEEEFREYLETLKKHGMSQILDIVPNHMCVECRDNRWWQDVLENGKSAQHAGYFDINWAPVKRQLTDKVLLPVLGAQFGKILESQELQVTYQPDGFSVAYYEHNFPLSPRSYPLILSHRMEELQQSLAPETVGQLQSVIGLLGALPSETETDPELTKKRYDDAEVGKKRLWQLYRDSEKVKAFIDENVRIYNGDTADPSSFALLERLLQQQSFRVAHWRVATEEINYRRFFDINGLGAIKVEEASVFDEVHALVLDLLEQGHVAGFRVDHADGLYNPVKYFHQLQYASFRRMLMQKKENDQTDAQMLERFHELLAEDPDFKPFYLVGEKILLGTERVPADWAIHGETGYSFVNSVSQLFIDQGSQDTLDGFYRSFTGLQTKFQDILYEKKKLIMYASMSSEINTLGYHLSTIAENNRHTRDYTLQSLIKTLVEVIAFFPVYRTYTNSLQISETDREHIELAVNKALRKSKGIDPSVFDFVRDVLTLNFLPDMEDDQKHEWLDFLMRFQQITGPVMAKGMEDTSFYMYNRLISLNEVGGDPDRFGLSLEEFHAQNVERVQSVPHALLATTTHDTKRSEDARIRINVLTEIPDEWTGAVTRWSKANRRHKKIVDNDVIPNANKEYLLYQTLMGAWPLNYDDPEEFGRFTQRIQLYMQKALREAKEHTSWINPNEPYEQAVSQFVDEVLADRTFIDDAKIFARQVAWCGMYASLSMTLLKLTCPGVPDFYQGSELWDLRLVDPDNRQPVDFEHRTALLAELKDAMSQQGSASTAQGLAENPEDGKVKLFLISKVLQFRKAHEELFGSGNYTPLEVAGARAQEVCAFSRRHDEEEVLVVAPRFFARLTLSGKRKPLGEGVWGGSRLMLPESEGVRYRNVITGDQYETKEGAIDLGEVLRAFPVALLEREKR